MYTLIGDKEGEHVTREMEAGKVYSWDWLFKFDTQCVRLEDCEAGRW